MGGRRFGKEHVLRWFCGQNRVTEGVEDIESCWDAWEGDELWDVSWVEQGQSRKGELTWLFIVIASRSWTSLCLSELGTLTRMLSSFLFPSSFLQFRSAMRNTQEKNTTDIKVSLPALVASSFPSS